MNPLRSEGSLKPDTALLVLFTIGVIACGDSARQPPALSGTTIKAGPDSMVETLADSTEVWMVAGRADTSTSGEVCTERLLELRRGDRRIPVPLLYTLSAPKAINDTTLRAALYRYCVVQAWYRVDTRTGLPRPERES